MCDDLPQYVKATLQRVVSRVGNDPCLQNKAQQYSDEELALIFDYTGAGHYYLNRNLWVGNKASSDYEKYLKCALEKAPKVAPNTAVFRKVLLNQQQKNRYYEAYNDDVPLIEPAFYPAVIWMLSLSNRNRLC